MYWWNSEVSKSSAASLERFVCHFGQYGFNWKWNIMYLGTLTIVIPRLPCLFRKAKAVSSTIELVNSVTSDSVNSFNFAMWAFASKCFPIELVPCSDRWRRTWWQDTYDAWAAGVLNSAVQIKSQRSRMSRIISSNRPHRAYIHWRPQSMDDYLQWKVAQITNKDTFIFGRNHNLEQQRVQRFVIQHGGGN